MTSLRQVSSTTTIARLAAVAVLALAVSAAPARADLTISVLDSTVSAGGTGSFDVVLQDTGGTFQVGGFQIELAVGAGSGLTFTAADTNTLEPYIFGTYQSAPFPFAPNPFPNMDFVAGDTDMTAPGFVTLNPGDVLGLAHVSFAVAAGTPPGGIDVMLVGANTGLNDVTGAPVPAGTADGTVTVAAVPEPSALALGSVGGALLLAFGRRRRRRR